MDLAALAEQAARSAKLAFNVEQLERPIASTLTAIATSSAAVKEEEPAANPGEEALDQDLYDTLNELARVKAELQEIEEDDESGTEASEDVHPARKIETSDEAEYDVQPCKFLKATSKATAAVPPWRDPEKRAEAEKYEQASQNDAQASQNDAEGSMRKSEAFRPRAGNAKGPRYGNRGGKFAWWYSARAAAAKKSQEKQDPTILTRWVRDNPKISKEEKAQHEELQFGVPGGIS